MDNYEKSPYGEVIYEFKYEFPKKFGNRIERILDRALLVIVALVLPFFIGVINELCLHILQTLQYKAMHNPLLLLKFDNLTSVFVLILAYGFMLVLVCAMYNNIIIMPRSKIVLYDKGMFIMATHLLGLWHKKKFYPYGSFGFYFTTTGYVFIISRVKIFDIDKKYSFFHKNSSVYDFTKNDEIQDMDKVLKILREKSAEALESQGKAGQYDLKEKIRYEIRSTNE